MDDAQRTSLLNIAIDAARQAGDLLLSHGEKLRSVDMETATDVKLRADRESEALIRKLLASTGIPVIGEEEGGDASLRDSDVPFWVVDPLDGTYNYLRTQPVCAVCIGLCIGHKAQLGVIYDFNLDLMYSGGPGLGLFINGAPHTSVWVEKDEQACLFTGFPAASDFSDEGLVGFVRDVQQFKKIRMVGSAAIAAVSVALGQGELYKETGCYLWDVAAGMALAEGAGGFAKMRYTNAPDKPFQVSIAIAGRERWLPEW